MWIKKKIILTETGTGLLPMFTLYGQYLTYLTTAFGFDYN